MKNKSDDLQRTEPDSSLVFKKKYPERQEMKEKFKAGAVPLASDFEALIDFIYDIAESIPSKKSNK